MTLVKASVDNYNRLRGVYSPVHEHNGIIYGFWLCGNDYHNPSGYYGAFPPSFLKRIGWLFADIEDYQVLHLFAGKTPPGTWKSECFVDINPEVLNLELPHIIGNAEELSTDMIAAGLDFDLIVADPPYDENHVKYGTKKVNKKKVVKECAKVLTKGGHLVWIDTIIPMWAKSDGYRLRGTIGMVQSTNHKCRVITILEKIS